MAQVVPKEFEVNKSKQQKKTSFKLWKSLQNVLAVVEPTEPQTSTPDYEKALYDICRSDVDELKSLKNPPKSVKLVTAAICVLKGIKPDYINDPENPSYKTIDYWGPSKRMLGDKNLLYSLLHYDINNAPADAILKIKNEYMTHPDFDFERMKSISLCAAYLLKWCLAIVNFHSQKENEPQETILARTDYQKNYAMKKTVSFYLDESYNRKKEDDQYFVTKSDMVQLKAMTQNNPPALFRDVLTLTCILKGVKPEIRDDPLHVGHTYIDYWGPSKRIFNIEEFYTFDIESISPEAIKKIKTEYLTKDEFQLKTIRSTSVALGNLFRWCLAMIRRYEEKYPTIATSTPDENENKEEAAQPKKVAKPKEKKTEIETSGTMNQLLTVALWSALGEIKKKDLVELRSLVSPPHSLKILISAVCRLLSIKPIRIVDPDMPWKQACDYWTAWRRVLSDPDDFIKLLTSYQPGQTPKETMEIIKNEAITKEEFKLEIIEKTSKAAVGLFKWCNAAWNYSDKKEE